MNFFRKSNVPAEKPIPPATINNRLAPLGAGQRRPTEPEREQLVTDVCRTCTNELATGSGPGNPTATAIRLGQERGFELDTSVDWRAGMR